MKIIRDEKEEDFTPATLLVEWKKYIVRTTPGTAHQLRLGGIPQPVLAWERKAGYFPFRFENHLGYTTFTLHDEAGRIVDESCRVEVVTDKLNGQTGYQDTLSQMLKELYQRVATLPFYVAAPTHYGSSASAHPPAPLLTLYFLLQNRQIITQALEMIQASPHRKLRDYPDFVPLHEANDLDAEVLVSILQNPQFLVTASGYPLADYLKGKAPTHVWQRRTEETYDTPENRLVLYIVREMLAAAEALASRPWWRIPTDTQLQQQMNAMAVQLRWQQLREVTGLLRQAMSYPIFSEVGQLHHLPVASQVMRRRAGYREMFELWQSFCGTRTPFLAGLDHAIDLRDAAKLYEYWVYFQLADKIEPLLCADEVIIQVVPTDLDGLQNQTRIVFKRAGELVGTLTYNQQRQSNYFLLGPDKQTAPYSFDLRPDYILTRPGMLDIGFDAKFRIDRELKGPKKDDMKTMLAYRSSLKLQAAIICYPGDCGCYNADCVSYAPDDISLLEAVIKGSYEGVGAISMRPASIS